MNVLIVGFGSIAKKHIHALNALQVNAVIYALRSGRDAEKVEGITNIFDLADMQEKFDFAIISNPTASHYDTIVNLLPLGIPLFIEKPLFHTLEHTSAILDLCHDSKVATYIACNLRFHPCVQYLKSYLNENPRKINEVNIYSGSYLPDWRPGQDFRRNYSAIPEMGGGVHLDLIHELDYACWLLGKPFASNKTLGNSSSLEIAATDYAHYQLMYPGYFANITLNYYRKQAKRHMEILMDDRTVEMDLFMRMIRRYSVSRSTHFTPILGRWIIFCRQYGRTPS